MSEINILMELENLQSKINKLARLHISKDLLNDAKKSLKADNFLFTFPYNFSLQPDDLIRKLAVINYCYGIFFFCEDKVIDDYNINQDEFQNLIIDMLNSHTLRNIGISLLLNLCGDEIFQYLFAYEKKYYKALIYEKSVKILPRESILDKENLIYMGHKLMPMSLTYTAYCLVKNQRENISVCEELIINYHIAKQLADDLVDIKSDLQKPDLSYLLKICNCLSDKKINSRAEVIDLLLSEDILHQYLIKAGEYISIAESNAKKLNFVFFLKEILNVKRMIAFVTNKINDEVSLQI